MKVCEAVSCHLGVARKVCVYEIDDEFSGVGIKWHLLDVKLDNQNILGRVYSELTS